MNIDRNILLNNVLNIYCGELQREQNVQFVIVKAQ